MSVKKVAVLVSGGGTNLQALIDAANAGKLPNARLSLVLSSREDAYALERARGAGIPVAVVKRTDSREDYSDRIEAVLRANGIDLIVLAGFMHILSGKLIREYENRIINVHPALIPSFCGEGYFGLRVHEAALRKGVKVTGATVHFVNEIADGGPIILQKAVAVEEGDTPETLQKRVMVEAEWKILPEALDLVSRDLVAVADGKTVIKK